MEDARLTVGQIIEKFQQEAPVNVLGIAAALGVNVWEDDLPHCVGQTIYR